MIIRCTVDIALGRAFPLVGTVIILHLKPDSNEHFRATISLKSVFPVTLGQRRYGPNAYSFISIE
jgi:hypothetical protein